jgi:NAD(P)-dependent dehydrogenase (short-subunit alcohol dehydrogenase family)
MTAMSVLEDQPEFVLIFPCVFEVNLVGMVRTMEALVPDWIERRAGHFIGQSSLADDFYNAHAPSYSASKAAFSSYLVSMAFKLREYRLYVTSIRFGFVDTKMAKAPTRPLVMSRERAIRHVIWPLCRDDSAGGTCFAISVRSWRLLQDASYRRRSQMQSSSGKHSCYLHFPHEGASGRRFLI